jgi:SAM-dependent methyltransferase
MNSSQLASVDVRIDWRSSDADHTEHYLVQKLNFWRDILPGRLSVTLPDSGGAWVGEAFPAGELVPPWSECNLHRVKRRQLKLHRRSGPPVVLQRGRFYPRRFAAGTADIFDGDMRPMRVIDADTDTVQLDLNHPLAQTPLEVAARVCELGDATAEHGGSCNDIVMDVLNGGVGLQAAMAKDHHALIRDASFSRLDEREDALFYLQPRLVQHLDSTAIAQIGELYRRFLKPGMQVLDFMSSWVSHIPDDLTGISVTGLGMNSDELEQNPRLSRRVVHDANLNPQLPFADSSFDAVICTASVEYLVRPVETFRELARIVKPGGPVVMTFSDRWFPSKAIELWSELHPFERMGLVLDYFREAGGFGTLATESHRGLPRPADDKYAGQRSTADPVFAVWGTRM